MGFPPILSCQDHVNESGALISRGGIPEGLEKGLCIGSTSSESGLFSTERKQEVTETQGLNPDPMGIWRLIRLRSESTWMGDFRSTSFPAPPTTYGPPSHIRDTGFF
jgi:hypothetical protein